MIDYIMDIQTQLNISIFLNFCFGVEGLYRDRDNIKNFCLNLKNKINSILYK